MYYDYDAIIIGGGGGGAIVAKELGEAGIKVALLEAGPWYGNKNWPNPNGEAGAKSSSSYNDLNIKILMDNFTDLEDDMNDQITGKFRWGPANRNLGPWIRITPEGGLVWQNSGIGGSTLHYFGNSPRAFPQSVNHIWPISYDELIPYFEKVEATLPVAPGASTQKEDLFYYGAKQAGYERIDTPDVMSTGYRPQPNAIFPPNLAPAGSSTNTQVNRPIGCTLRGHCINGCRIGASVDTVAKRTTLVSYIPLALRTGNVEIIPNAFVTKIITQDDTKEGLHADGVLYRNTWTGETFELRAKVIIMSGGAVETPRLWLNSQLPKNAWVGKGLVNHLFDCVTGIFDENVLMNVLGVPTIPPYVGQNAAARFDYPGLGAIQTFGVSPGLLSSMVYANSRKGFNVINQPNSNAPWDIEGMIVGEKLKELMMDYNRTLCLLILTDDDVNQNNSVTLDPVRKDENGFIPVIQYNPSEEDQLKRHKLAVIAADILRRAGARTIVHSDWPAEIYIHMTSTMRIGYVTDINCESFQVKRLYIADNSVLFNGVGGANPTLTTQALATRTSEKIIRKYFSNT